MKWSWSIGRIAGIDIRVHATFLLLVGFYALSSWALEGYIIHGIRMGVFILTLFGCIVLHELGHALTAKRFGIATRDITLLPIGGIAHLETIPEEPRKELLIAVAGPVVSAAIAVAFYGASFLTAGNVDNRFAWGGGPLLQQFGAANLFLVLFNLLPAFPMDGGRILRAALAPSLGSLRATEIATRVGQFAAVIFGLTGLFFNPMLMLIAVLIWFGAAHEAAAVQMRALLREHARITN